MFGVSCASCTTRVSHVALGGAVRVCRRRLLPRRPRYGSGRPGAGSRRLERSASLARTAASVPARPIERRPGCLRGLLRRLRRARPGVLHAPRPGRRDGVRPAVGDVRRSRWSAARSSAARRPSRSRAGCSRSPARSSRTTGATGSVERTALARLGVPVPGLTDPQIERIEDMAGLSEVAAPLADAMASLPSEQRRGGRAARGRGVRLRRGRAGARRSPSRTPAPASRAACAALALRAARCRDDRVRGRRVTRASKRTPRGPACEAARARRRGAAGASAAPAARAGAIGGCVVALVLGGAAAAGAADLISVGDAGRRTCARSTASTSRRRARCAPGSSLAPTPADGGLAYGLGEYTANNGAQRAPRWSARCAATRSGRIDGDVFRPYQRTPSAPATQRRRLYDDRRRRRTDAWSSGAPRRARPTRRSRSTASPRSRRPPRADLPARLRAGERPRDACRVTFHSLTPCRRAERLPRPEGWC